MNRSAFHMTGIPYVLGFISINPCCYFSEEAVRDVRFSPHQYFNFAVCLENGNVQFFDMRVRSKGNGCFDSFLKLFANIYLIFFFINKFFFYFQRADMCEREFTCHAGPVFQSHFHPLDKQLLATCGRDKCIKVWNVFENKNPTLEFTISTIAPMGSIAWRPCRTTYIASTALVTDFSISVRKIYSKIKKKNLNLKI